MAVNRERSTREELLREFSIHDFDGKLSDLMEWFHNLSKEYTDLGFTDLKISVEQWYDDTEVSLRGSRPETDNEMEIRIANEIRHAKQKADAAKRRAERAIAKEAEERALLKKLQEKYGTE